jgi:hypothetical protein
VEPDVANMAEATVGVGSAVVKEIQNRSTVAERRRAVARNPKMQGLLLVSRNRKNMMILIQTRSQEKNPSVYMYMKFF